jgi:hypothetical protein
MPLDGPHTCQIPGISIAHLCVGCRQDYQRFIFLTYPELTAEFDEAIAAFHQAHSGFPTSSGMTSGEDVFTRHVAMEASMIVIWDEFLASKKEENEQGEKSRAKDGD